MVNCVNYLLFDLRCYYDMMIIYIDDVDELVSDLKFIVGKFGVDKFIKVVGIYFEYF